ncbi:MAG: hypothetical protein HYX47_10075 [Burkholderiales bacterium]|nr:hypothetical protein [Burkholderiales bacterium]
MIPMSRRSIVVGTTALLLSKLPEAATSAASSGEVVARAAYSGRDSHWQITLTDKYAAKYSAQLSRIPAGSLSGDFRFYDTEFADKEHLERFLQLPRSILSLSPSIHPDSYEIAVKNVATNAFHEVVVLFNRDMPPSENLVLFFSVWRSIWSGVPGYPRAPGQYAG